MKRKVLITKYGTIIDLVPTRDWHFGFSFRNWRIGGAFEESMWQFDFLWFFVWCDRYNKHGDTLNKIPQNAKVLVDQRAVADFQEIRKIDEA